MRRILALPLVAALLVPLTGIPAATAARSRSAAPHRIALHACTLEGTVHAQCGSIRVPLDYTDPAAPTIRIGFGWVAAKHPDGHTILAQEGGPGYPATGTAAEFSAVFGSLLRTRNLLLVDARGTGRSTPLDCEPLQSLPSPSTKFQRAVTACGNQLNHTWKRSNGTWVHASDLFTTANTAQDTARVVEALHAGPVDLYGDSYGTYFAQSFLARYPHLLRSVVLDSAYEARDLDPWYTTTVTTARRAFDTVCRRAKRCPSGSSWQRISALARLLRAHPIHGTAVGTDAHLHRTTVGVTQLVDIVNDAGYDFDPYRQLDAATRAYLDHRDKTPLLRLWLQDVGYDYSDYSAHAAYYSDGLYMAVACSDYPQLFDMHSTPARRRAELNESIGKEPPRTFAPFTVREWLSVLPYTETYTGCLTWPAPTHRADPPIPSGASMDATHVPVLILNGQLDSLTPAAGGAHIARQIGSAAHAYVAANTVHLVALASAYACGPQVVRRFVAAPHARLNTRCLRHLPAVRAVPRFATSARTSLPATGHASLDVRRWAGIALSAAGDAVYRFDYVDGSRDRGLRGGTVRYSDAGDAHLHAVRWTRGTTVTGTVHVVGNGYRATLQVRTRHHRVRATVSWHAPGHGSRTATIRIGGHHLHAPAP